MSLEIVFLRPQNWSRLKSAKTRRGRREGDGKKNHEDLGVAKELLREELTKCRAYGQRDGFNLQALDRGMTPVVLEQFGRTTSEAQAIFNRIINHRLQILVRQGLPFSFAKRTASSELWGPISCTLLRTAWQAHAE